MLKKLFEKYSGLRYVLSSAAAFVVDTALYYVFNHFLFGMVLNMGNTPASDAALISARAISSFFNFNVNNFIVFRHGKEGYGSALAKYYCLCLPQLLASELLLHGATVLFGVEDDFAQTVAKVVVDGVLFVISYFIQHKWVFSASKNKNETASD